MEGVGGVNNADEQLLPRQRRYDESRHVLAGELNAAVEGALAAGATEVVIWDGHDGSRSISIEDIHPRAQLIQGKPTPANYYLSDRAYDGIMFVGQHAMAGAKGGVLAHSQSFSVERDPAHNWGTVRRAARRMGASYMWIDQQRLSGAKEGSFLVWFENHSEALVISPVLPRNTESNSPVDVRWLLSQVAY